MSWNSGPQYGPDILPVGELLAAEAAGFINSVVIARLTADFPDWTIDRPPSPHDRRFLWGARHAGTVIITGTAGELRASLAEHGQEGRQ